MTRLEFHVKIREDIKAFEAALEHKSKFFGTSYSPGCISICANSPQAKELWDAATVILIEQINKYIPSCEFEVDIQCYDHEMLIII